MIKAKAFTLTLIIVNIIIIANYLDCIVPINRIKYSYTVYMQCSCMSEKIFLVFSYKVKLYSKSKQESNISVH